MTQPTAYDAALDQQQRERAAEEWRRQVIDARVAGANGVIRLPLRADRIEATIKRSGRFDYVAAGRTISLIPIRSGWHGVMLDGAPVAFDRDLASAVERLRAAVDSVLAGSE